MIKLMSDDHVLPRPVERLPDYAHAKARQTLADKIIDAFGFSEASASAIANAVVDPSEVRKSIGDTTDPDVEKFLSRAARCSASAPASGRGGRCPIRAIRARCRPGGIPSPSIPAPAARIQVPPGARAALLNRNDGRWRSWRWTSRTAITSLGRRNRRLASFWPRMTGGPSIESQGVMEAVWLVATTYQHADGSAPATTLTTVEGSSRDTAVHSILGIHSADVPYDDSDAKLRAHIRKLNDAYERGERDRETLVAAALRTDPALILVGFRPHAEGATGFPTAVKSLVALRHVDPPKPWGEGPRMSRWPTKYLTNSIGAI